MVPKTFIRKDLSLVISKELVISSWRRAFKMFLEIFIFILCLTLFVAYGGKQTKIIRKWKVFKISVNAVFDFVFRMKAEERLDAFRKIHKLFPKFTHFDFLGLKVLLVYDPVVAKKWDESCFIKLNIVWISKFWRVFTSVQAMQRPFRSYAPLDKGLLFSSCKSDKILLNLFWRCCHFNSHSNYLASIYQFTFRQRLAWTEKAFKLGFQS